MRMRFTVLWASIIWEARAQDEGQTLVEYALVMWLVSIALVASLVLFGGDLVTVYDSIIGKI